LANGKKTLRFSEPSIRAVARRLGRLTTIYGPRAGDRSVATKSLTRRQIAGLRRSDPIEIRAGKLREW
jgi:hypothetical protein